MNCSPSPRRQPAIGSPSAAPLRALLQFFMLVALAACTNGALYKDSSKPVAQRVENLLSQMTLEEKVAQLDMLDASSILETSSELSPAKM